jgi:RNA polymerase sigma-70 factor (ECF subfamily)
MDAEELDDYYAGSFGRPVHQPHAMTGDRDEAQECVQEAFVRAWWHRGRAALAELLSDDATSTAPGARTGGASHA